MTNAYRPTSDLVHEQVAVYEATDGEREIPVMVLEPRGPIGI